jgi:hypothetical protein
MIKEGFIQNFDNLCLIELPLVSSIFLDLLLIDEELYLHECVFGYDPLQLGH